MSQINPLAQAFSLPAHEPPCPTLPIEEQEHVAAFGDKRFPPVGIESVTWQPVCAAQQAWLFASGTDAPFAIGVVQVGALPPGSVV